MLYNKNNFRIDSEKVFTIAAEDPKKLDALLKAYNFANIYARQDAVVQSAKGETNSKSSEGLETELKLLTSKRKRAVSNILYANALFVETVMDEKGKEKVMHLLLGEQFYNVHDEKEANLLIYNFSAGMDAALLNRHVSQKIG